MESIVAKPAGEDEFADLEDLTEKFLPRESYRALFDAGTFLLLGRKGAGKSALFQALRHPEYAQHLAVHFGLDASDIGATRFGTGFDGEIGRRFERQLSRVESFNSAAHSGFWEILIASQVAKLEGDQPRLAALEATEIVGDGEPGELGEAAFEYLEATSARLSAKGERIVLAFDNLDTGLPREVRPALLSALVGYWQRNLRARPGLGCKIFLRTDLWRREVSVEDKSKLRDGIDRTDISWDGIDIYRLVLKRLMGSAAVETELRRNGLWYASFDSADATLGVIPPRDEAWTRGSIETITGSTMGSGASGHKRGYVYTWLQSHLSDASGALHPRFALLAFSEAAKVQGTVPERGPLLAPKSFVRSLRGEVSTVAVDDLAAEYPEWKVDGDASVWIPRRFAELERVWPIPAGRLEAMLKKLRFDKSRIADLIDRMVEAGLLDRREGKGGVTYQIPDIYLFGLELTRRG